MIRFVGRIVVLAVLALLGALGGDLPGVAGALLGASPALHASASAAPDEPAEDVESTTSVDESPEDDGAFATLARSPGESGEVIAPSFTRAPVVARAQAAPKTVDHEIAPRPPRG